MNEVHHILSLWHELQEAGEAAVLATVVHTAGSSYRLPGARLLVAADGRRAGSISGGCLEEDLLKKAWWLTGSGPVLRRYDTRADEDTAEVLDGERAEAGFGLGCNGVITILLERLQPGAPNSLQVASAVRKQRRPATIAHALTPPLDRRWIESPDGRVEHNLPADLAPAIRDFLQSAADRPCWAEFEAQRFFIETLTPPVRLLIFGAGEDAGPLVRLARLLDWPVSVFDSRPHYARPEKFPGADAVVVRPIDMPLPVELDPWTAVVLMSHSYSQDLDVLRELMRMRAGYLGLLGPRRRSERLLNDAGAPSQFRAALHAPAGLDLGADGPDQVALAIAAEIQAVFNERSGGFLRSAPGPIHARAHDAESEFVLSANPVCY